MTGAAPGSASVREIWRYPVKSMIGERLPETLVTTAGVLGDRGWAVRDEVRGGIRGAKKIGSLMQLAARYTGAPTIEEPVPDVEIVLPDGGTVGGTDPDVNERISAALDHPVTLWPLQPATDLDHYRRGAPDSDDMLVEFREMFAREEDEPLPDLSGMPPELMMFESPPGTYFDAYPILVLTTTSMETIAALSPGSVVDVRRFRPNLLVDVGDDAAGGFPEQAWIGRTLRIGEVELEVVTGCPRCVMITRAVADVPQDRSLMRTVVRHADHCLGVYASVTKGGQVREGDALEVV